MKILNLEIKRVPRAESSDETFVIQVAAEYLKQDILSVSSLSMLSSAISDKLADELYPDVKDALLKHSGLQKIISEIRLDNAKKLLK